MNYILKTKGFSLVEVMVSIVLLTISMLGLAALQNSSTKFDHQAYLRSQSVILADDIIDKMRSNAGGDYNISPRSYAKDCGQLTNECTEDELAIYDLVKWNSLNRSSLPSGIGQVSYTSIATIMVSVFWTEQENEKQVGVGYINPCDGSNDEELHCFQMEVQL